jgi:SNF2 family DNA or RNA helicase
MPTLLDFQVECIDQLLKHEEATGDRSALIGDDMGLGKTVEGLVLDVEKRKKHNCAYTAQTLIVTQTSVIGSWKDHILGENGRPACAPWAKVYAIDRKDRAGFVKALQEKDALGLPKYQYFICHWQVLRFIPDELREVSWFHIIGDEIQNIKNRTAQQTQLFKKLKTYYKTGLSGTWADNKPDDAWSVLNWLWPKVWTSYWAFYNHHVIFEEKLVKGRTVKIMKGVHNEELIHERMGNAYVRRTKEEVWDQMPDKTPEDRLVDLHPKQRSAYDAMARDMLAWVGKNEDQPVPAPTVVAKLVRLQQFAVAHGKLEKYVSKGQELVRLVLDDPSSKLDACMDIIEATNESVLIFGQSKQAINLLATRLQRAGVPAAVLTGDTKQADRDLAVQQFQSGAKKVFLSTIKAGGVGLTLTAATLVLFLDRAWSPTANKQAEDRAHRLGQKNAVLIITLVARDTIDRERNAKIELKWTWLKQVLEPKRKVAA